MYLTVCPPCGRVMIAQWENECISLSVLPVAGLNVRPWRSISRDFFPADHTLPPRPDPSTRPEPAWQRMTQSTLNGITQPVNIEEEVHPWTENG